MENMTFFEVPNETQYAGGGDVVTINMAAISDFMDASLCRIVCRIMIMLRASSANSVFTVNECPTGRPCSSWVYGQ